MARYLLRNKPTRELTLVVFYSLYALAGFAVFTTLLIARQRDPAGNWLGFALSDPDFLYIPLEAVSLTWATVMACLARVKWENSSNDSLQIIVDSIGIHVEAPEEKSLRWCDFVKITGQKAEGLAPRDVSMLSVELSTGETIDIDISRLDASYEEILFEVKKFFSGAMGGSKRSERPANTRML